MKQILTLFITLICLSSISRAEEQIPASTTPEATSKVDLPTETAPPPRPIEFQKKIDLNGDLRYRYQAVTQATNQERRINRMMFRAGQTIQVQEDLKITYRLLTGTAANSGNVTNGDPKSPGAPRQSIGLDHAYAQYTPVEETSLFIGKFPQFFYTPGKNQLILDSDIATEGAAAQFNFSLVDKILKSTLHAGSFWVREKYDETYGQDLTDSFLNVAQLNLNYAINEHFELNGGYGVFSYTAVKDDKPASYVSGATSAKGNTLDLLGNYPTQFEIVQNYLELKWKPNPVTISLFIEQDKNTAANDLNKASAYGFSLAWKKLTLTWQKKKLENDSVLALYTDSDFADGQTASQGTSMTLSYKANKNFNVALTQQKSQQAIDVAAIDYNRTHFDLTFTF